MTAWFKRVSLGILLSTTTSCLVPLCYAESPYIDLRENNAYYEGITAMTEVGAVSGYEDGSFHPTQDVTRAEAIKMILTATGVDLEENIEGLAFPDTDEEAWYKPYLDTAAAKGIITGAEDGYFYPKNTVNRAEALKMLMLSANKESALPNGPDDTWYSAYLQYAIDHALLAPDANGNYTPAAPMSRGELCELLYRFQTEPYTSQVEYGIGSYYGYSYDGHNTASGRPLDTEAFQAAHKSLPFGTRIRVTNVNTGASVIVEVVDRGPYTQGYVIDLTPAAFEQLGNLSAGILKVRLEVLK